MRKIVLYIFLFTSIFSKAQAPSDKTKATFISEISSQFIWPANDEIENFTIAVFGKKNEGLALSIENLLKGKKINGKPIVVERFKTIIEFKRADLIYVNENDKFDNGRLLKKVKDQPVLILVENTPDFNKSMIAFIENKGKIQYTFNSSLIVLKCNEAFKNKAIQNESEWQKIFATYKEQNESEKKKVLVSKSELESIVNETEEKNKELEEQRLQNEKSLEEIEDLSFEAQAKELKIRAQNNEIRRNKLEAKNREQENELLKREKLLKDSESQSQKTIITIVSIALVLILIFTFFVIRSWYFTRKQKEIIEAQKARVDQQKGIILSSKQIIEEKNKDITDSITYAQRIQQAKLPDIFEVNSELKDSFILFKPKDIVSGDFYFFQKNKNGSYLAAVDCTGHGVPGAFMSLIGSDKLEAALHLHSEPSHILNHLNKSLKKSLRQNRKDDSTRDGMDIALCWLDLKNMKLKFAGANRPLWIFRNGKTLLEEYKPTKRSIGGFTEDHQEFEMHEIVLNKGDSLYMFSDGFADTFSATSGKKLTTKKFKEVLASIQNLSMKDQGIYLEKFIDDWKAGEEQVDDILVVGLRI